MADLDTIELVKDIDVDKYKYGFTTDIESDFAPKGLSEDIVRFISNKKGEPAWMLEARLEAYRRWLQMEEPTWARVDYPKIDFPGPLLLRGSKEPFGPQKPGRDRSQAARDLCKARHSIEGTGDPRRGAQAGREERAG